ncbi:MAG: sigma-70 family RNA polymerase sigma factor [Blastocatellia bacterium]|nr:sigma-70 family RNA polymerase sigma factor [Blastocatellia bacterium]
MESLSPSEFTMLLKNWRSGDQTALDRLMPVVYEELRRIASSHMARERSDHTLQTTALVHEAYLKLVKQKDIEWQDRAHFLCLASRFMRQILVDHARTQTYQKRGGGAIQVSLDDNLKIAPDRSAEFLALDEALTRLAAVDPRKCQIVEMRSFSGMTVEEIAEVLNLAPVTVMRDWRFAKAWLQRELRIEN